MQHRSSSNSRDGHSSTHDTREGSSQKRILEASIKGSEDCEAQLKSQLSRLCACTTHLCFKRPVPVARLDLVSVSILARADAESHPHCTHGTSRTQKAAVSAQSQVVCAFSMQEEATLKQLSE